jgi:GNAT superfamily N-acetyltransferase
VHNYLDRSDAVEIVDLVVRLDHRRQGIGRQLLNAAETWAQATERRSMIIFIQVPNSTAHGFLTALQFDQQTTTLEFVRQL